MNILLVEDEARVVDFIREGLEEQGYTVSIAYDGIIGKKLALSAHHDVILIDIIIPGINGIELCSEIKKVKPEVPVMMLTALGAIEDKVAGFDAGADDYLVKPFEFKELLSRIRSLTRRNTGIFASTKKIKVADLELDLDKKIAIRNEKKIELTQKEFLLLELLMLNRGKVLSRAEIAEKIWEITFDTGTNVVDVYINLLRKKIDQGHTNKLIHTKIGFGYIMQEV